MTPAELHPGMIVQDFRRWAVVRDVLFRGDHYLLELARANGDVYIVTTLPDAEWHLWTEEHGS